ncbi:extensin family protein [Leptolyngbya sp. 15MV]|nr:extensin family protein [Leptolyngbya sp. 15MV]
MARILALALLAMTLSACGNLVPGGRSSQAPRPPSQAAIVTPSPQTQQCLADLGAAGARFVALPDRYMGEGCALLGTVSLSAVRSDLDSLGVSNLGPVACPTASAFSDWARFGVDRAARQILGSRASICRWMSPNCLRCAPSWARPRPRSGPATSW